MLNRFDLLTQQLFQKNIDDCSIEELKNITNQFPYFAPAQYALLKKLQLSDHSAYTTQLQKAILYYHNPPLFEQFINEDSYEFETPVDGQEVFPPLLKEQPDDIEVQEQSAAEHTVEEESTEVSTVEEPAELGAEETTNVESDLPSEESIHEEDALAGDEMEADIEEAPLTVSLPSLNEPPQDAGTGLAFEPYHTVDYFASQGIKLSQEEATKDRFGRQLKSFTEWLKTMKKVPASEQLKPIDTASEQKVENLAAHSVEEAEIVTEAMAEVWLKQGNTEKAIEIYNKLSLLNPPKRTYFAAKVDSLKKEI